MTGNESDVRTHAVRQRAGDCRGYCGIAQEAVPLIFMEAEVTSGLEHPGIVPVHGLRQFTDGRPFYAMRFIRGDSLQESADAFHFGSGLFGGNGPTTL